MTILKCKMCGGNLDFEEGATVVECEYCGTKQTVPTIDDEKKITLFARANRLRFACEFDKASGVYESIVADLPEEAEAYWGLVLCRYGIEYVDDPATGKKIPTCHRSSFESVMEDDNFEQVLENADPIARAVYREEAKQIEELRRGIIEVSNKEEPYDIFICYKETAENGERTIDSVIAQDVYDELTARGYRVFFSRITLEDKLGQEYEPYIFAALNSAKVMLAFGTDYEYYNAVWVKNEWSRFLQLIAKGEKKTLIPCYKNIDAYDMPKAFAKLQAQDMGKIGAMQDLLRGIEKLLPRKEAERAAQAQPGKETFIVQHPAQSATVDSLLKRAFMYLEDGEWSNAADYCNRVLDIDPEIADAYVGLLMADLQVKKEEELAGQTEGFVQNKHFIKAIRFAGEERRKALEGYIKAIKENLAEQQNFLLKQAFMYLEKGDWSNSNDCCNRVLGISPENADAYVGLLMAELLTRKEEDLARQTKRFGQNEHFLKAVQFADGERRKVLEGYNKAVEDYIAEQQEKERQRQVEEKKRQEEEKQRQKEKQRQEEEEKRRQKEICCRQLAEKRQSIKKVSGLIKWLHPYRETIIGVKSNGTMLVAGLLSNFIRYKMLTWKDIVMTSTNDHIIGLKSDGTVVAAGNNKWGQCKVSSWKDIISVVTGQNHTVGLKSDGTVVAAGDNRFGQCNVSDWKDIVSIAAEGFQTIGLRSDGTVVAAGDNRDGACNISAWRDITAIMTSLITVGLKSDGTVVTTDSANVSNWRDIVAVKSWAHTIIGLKSDGTVVATGSNEHGQCDVSDWTDIIAVDLWAHTTVGLKSDGTVVATGSNEHGQCNVSSWIDIVAVKLSDKGTIGLRSNGTVLVTSECLKREVMHWHLFTDMATLV